jgi:16S rRNA (guanine527-N7)-methyltransferase
MSRSTLGSEDAQPSGVPAAIPDPPVGLQQVFPPSSIPTVLRYAQLLAGPGVEHGLLGPREVPKLWDRHILSSAVVTRALADVPGEPLVADVGSGAGLPGIPMALADPRLRMVLLEPVERRAAFLTALVDDLGLSARVRVDPVRAEQSPRLRGTFDVVTARAVAPLSKLLGWVTPLMGPTGRLVLVKGARVADELLDARPVIRRLHLSAGEVIVLGEDVLAEPTTVVVCFQRQG